MSRLTTIYSTLLALVLLGMLSCSREHKQTSILATVGDESISLADFKRAYLPVLLYSDKKESPATREEILKFLIDQSILAQTARSLELDTIQTLEVLRRTALKTAFTRILYRKQVKEKLPAITDQELRQAYRRSHTQRLVRHLFSKDSSEAVDLYSQLAAGASWDSLASAHFKEPSLAATGGVLGWMKFGDMDPDFEAAAYSLPLKTPSQPVRTQFGWHIIQADEESRELMLTEYDYQLERSSLERTLRQREEQRLADTAINRMMDAAALRFNEAVAARVWDLMRQQIRRLIDAPDLNEIPDAEFQNFEELLGPLSHEEMLSFAGAQWTVGDFLAHLPEMNRQLMLTDLKQATAFLVRDEVIYQTGLEQELDQRSDVRDEVHDRENQFLANLYLRYRASSQQLSSAAVTEFYRQQANTLYLAPDSLQIQELRPADPASAAGLVTALNSGSTLEAVRRSLSLDILDLGWFQGSRSDHPDYYHRLVEKPLKTAVGPLDSPRGPVIIRALQRRRHPKPLEDIYNRVEADAFEQWLTRLRLQEVNRLKAAYPITIDRELLLSFEI